MNQALNIPMIKTLILKDWHLNQKIMAMYVAGSIFALSFISLGEWQFYMGSTLLISMLVGLGNHQIFANIVLERKEQTLPFIMSLPITPLDYAMAKLIAAMSIFLTPWLLIVLSTIAVFSFTSLPDGMIPVTIILCCFFLLSYCVVWATGMIFETEAMVIFVMVTFNCLISPAIYLLGKTSDIASHMGSPTAVWNSTSIGFVVGQILVSMLAVSTALYIQTRKKTFL